MKVRWLRAALRDLDTRADYMARDNPLAVRRMVATVVTAVNLFADHPAMGRPGRIVGTRELVCPPYIIPYRVRENTVEILRFFQGSQRWPDEM